MYNFYTVYNFISQPEDLQNVQYFHLIASHGCYLYNI